LIDCSRKKITALIILKNLEKKNKKQKTRKKIGASRSMK
jgi:hypothetical protein